MRPLQPHLGLTLTGNAKPIVEAYSLEPSAKFFVPHVERKGLLVREVLPECLELDLLEGLRALLDDLPVLRRRLVAELLDNPSLLDSLQLAEWQQMKVASRLADQPEDGLQLAANGSQVR